MNQYQQYTNHVIKYTSLEEYEEAKEYWKSKGVDIKNLSEFSITWDHMGFYGDRFDTWVKFDHAIIIDLKNENIKTTNNKMELIPNEKYKLRPNGDFCHVVYFDSVKRPSNNIADYDWFFINQTNIPGVGLRNFFYCDQPVGYAMFGIRNPEDYATVSNNLFNMSKSKSIDILPKKLTIDLKTFSEKIKHLKT